MGGLDQFGQVEYHPCMRRRKKAPSVREPVSLYEAKTHLSELVEQAAQGREIVIAKSGKPKARLVPLAPKDTRHLRKPGRGKGRGWIADDFDAPLPPEVCGCLPVNPSEAAARHQRAGSVAPRKASARRHP